MMMMMMMMISDIFVKELALRKVKINERDEIKNITGNWYKFIINRVIV